MENVLLDNAIKYAERGWYVFPCRERDSKPFIRKGKEIVIPAKAPYIKGGFKSSTTNADQIKEWWRRYPEAGIGIDCGQSNLTVVDIDVRDGKTGLDSFSSLNISDEDALHSITPSGGIHLIYSGKTNSYANVKSGIDIRSIGAYILAPPSWIYENGNKREYKSVGNWNKSLNPIPDSLVKSLNELRGSYKKKQNPSIPPIESEQQTISRVKKALDKLPQWMCDDYFQWIRVGMALKTLGDSGLDLWNNWSKKSEKYDEDALIYRWENFSPSNITIASIFHYAYNSKGK